MCNISPLVVKSDSWPSRGGTVSNQQKKEKGGYIWRLKTSALGRISVASSHPRRRKISNFKTREDGALQSWQTTHVVENYTNN